jgi:hypothetical protein
VWTANLLNQLQSQLKHEIDRFIKAKENHIEAFRNQRRIVDSTMEFEEEFGRHGVKTIIGDTALRWNHQGFKIKYSTKKDFIKVGEFYLKNLLIDRDVIKP